jgi:hypothetical protein
MTPRDLAGHRHVAHLTFSSSFGGPFFLGPFLPLLSASLPLSSVAFAAACSAVHAWAHESRQER